MMPASKRPDHPAGRSAWAPEDLHKPKPVCYFHDPGRRWPRLAAGSLGKRAPQKRGTKLEKYNPELQQAKN